MTSFLEAQLTLQRQGLSREEARSQEGLKEAVALLQRAVNRAPQEAVLWRYLAQLLAELPDPRRAVTAARRSVLLDQGDGHAHYLLGEQLSRLGRLDEAELALLEARSLPLVRNYQHLPHYHLYRLRKKRGALDLAVEALDFWKATLPEDGNPLELKARLLWAHGEPEEAQLAAMQALAEAPADQELVALLEQVFGSDLLGLEAALQDVAARDWSVAELHRSLISVNNRIGRYDRSQHHLRILSILEGMGERRLRMHQARLDLAMGRGEEAENRLRPLLDPQTQEIGEAELLSLRAALAQGGTDRVIEVLDAAPWEDFGRLAGEEALIQHLIDRGSLTEAWDRLRPRFDVPLLSGATYGELWGLGVQLALRRGAVNEAESLLDALEESGDQAPFGARLALLEAKGAREEALALVRERVADGLGEIRALVISVGVLSRLDRVNEAVALVNEALAWLGQRRDELIGQGPSAERIEQVQALADERAELLLMRSGLERLDGDVGACESSLRALLEERPDDPDGLNALAYLFAEESERLEEGLSLVERALEMRPFSGATIDTKAWLLHRMGRDEEALTLLRRAMVFLPHEAEILDHLGDVLFSLGRREEAISSYAAALRVLDPTTPLQRRLRPQIEAKLSERFPDRPRP